jgi:hypothetical protein
MLTRESRAIIGGPGCAYRGPVLPRGGLVQLILPGMYHRFPPHDAPWAAHMVGSSVVHHLARERCMAPRLHTIVRGTPDLGYRQWPPGPH